MNLSDIPRDKQLHALAGAAASLVACLFIGSAWAGVIAAALAGIAKELYDRDRRENHTPDLFDLAATVIGGVAVAVIYGVIA